MEPQLARIQTELTEASGARITLPVGCRCRTIPGIRAQRTEIYRDVARLDVRTRRRKPLFS